MHQLKKEIIQFVQIGLLYNKKINKKFKISISLFSRREYFSVVKECLIYSERSDNSFKYRKRSLNQLRKGHPGQNRMKDLARSYVHWPNIDVNIVDLLDVA